MNPVLLYIAASLPCRTETFVYREVLCLRKRGWRVEVASVHEPETNLGDPDLEKLANECIRIYSQGIRSFVWGVLCACLKRPKRFFKTILFSLNLATKTQGTSLLRRVKFMWQTLAALSIAEKINCCGITHIHSHMAHVPTSVALILSEHLNIPFSFTGHAVDLFRERAFLEEKLTRTAFCVCISEWHRTFYQSLAKIDHERLPLVRCGVDITMFKPTQLTQSLDAERNMISVGRLVPKKGFDHLIQAISLLNIEGVNWSLEIIGEGPYRARLETLIHNTHLSPRLRLLGAKTHEEVHQSVLKSTIFVLPCKIDETGDRDGIPVALMEAMACGIPVIAGDLPAIRELVENEVSGLLVNPENPEEIADAITRLMESSELCTKLGMSGRKRVVEEFSFDLNLQRLQEAFLRKA